MGHPYAVVLAPQYKNTHAYLAAPEEIVGGAVTFIAKTHAPLKAGDLIISVHQLTSSTQKTKSKQ